MHLNKFFERITHNWPIKILSIAAAVLLFLFNQTATLEERFLSVPLEIRTAEQLIPAENYPRTVRVTMRGQSEDINLVLEDDITVYADFMQYEEEGRYTVPIRVVKEGSLAHIDPLELQVEPKKLSLKIEKKLSKSVKIEPLLVGYPAKGYELTQYFLTPSTVEIEGLESSIKNMKAVETEPIDLSGRTEDFTVRLRLKKPDQFASFPGGDTVEFFGIIQEKTILKTVENIDLIALDLAEDLAVSGVPQDTQMTVQGSQLRLEKVNTEDFMLTFDCSGIEEPGTYELEVSPDVPRGVLVLKYSPTSVEVDITRLEEPE
ncbi:MAG: YbbR-like domain-containing protein [Spirochaetota bacterium]